MQGIKIKMIVCCSAMFVLSASGAEGKQKVARKKSQENVVVRALLENTSLPTDLCRLIFGYYYGGMQVKETPVAQDISDSTTF